MQENKSSILAKWLILKSFFKGRQFVRDSCHVNYIHKNAKLAEGTTADVMAQMFEDVVHNDLKLIENSFIRIFILR